MMKKVYVEPTVDVMGIKMESLLQSASGMAIDSSDENSVSDVTELLSRGSNSLWDDDEEDF